MKKGNLWLGAAFAGQVTPATTRARVQCMVSAPSGRQPRCPLRRGGPAGGPMELDVPRHETRVRCASIQLEWP